MARIRDPHDETLARIETHAYMSLPPGSSKDEFDLEVLGLAALATLDGRNGTEAGEVEEAAARAQDTEMRWRKRWRWLRRTVWGAAGAAALAVTTALAGGVADDINAQNETLCYRELDGAEDAIKDDWASSKEVVLQDAAQGLLDDRYMTDTAMRACAELDPEGHLDRYVKKLPSESTP